jgi:hypothetical protein
MTQLEIFSKEVTAGNMKEVRPTKACAAFRRGMIYPTDLELFALNSSRPAAPY